MFAFVHFEQLKVEMVNATTTDVDVSYLFRIGIDGSFLVDILRTCVMPYCLHREIKVLRSHPKANASLSLKNISLTRARTEDLSLKVKLSTNGSRKFEFSPLHEQ